MSECGTQIILNGDYPYDIPSAPTDVTQIINHEITDINEQYWRTPVPPDFNKMSEYEKERYIEREWDRIVNGAFFMNRGVIVYVNGAHYQYLAYWKVDYEIRFLHVDRLYFFFDEFVDCYTPAYGKVIYKPRRGGFSAKENFLAYRKATFGMWKNVVLLNTTLDNAKDINYTQISNAYLELPFWLKPQIDQVKEDQVKKLGMVFKKLKGYIKPKAPLANSVDGKKTAYILWDEIFKLISLDPQVIITAFFEAMYDKINDKLVGKITLVSTLGEDDRLMGQAIEYAKKIWGESDIKDVNERGETKSKLLRYFISAYEVLAIDKYGFGNIERAKEIYEQEIQEIINDPTKGKDSFEHISFLRKNPRTIEDILNSPKAGNVFNADSRITIRREKVKLIPIENRGYVGGKFIMENGQVYFDTSIENQNYGWVLKGLVRGRKNLCRRVGQDWKLPPKPEGTVGYDPVLLDDPVSKNISQPSITIFKKLDHYSKNGIKNQIQGVYIGGRKLDNDELTEQAALAAIFFGYWLSPERNTGVHLKYLKRNHFNKIMVVWDDGGYGIQITNAKGERNVLDKGINSIYKWCISKQSDGTPNLDTLSIDEMLVQLESFTADKLPKHDHIASFLQAKLSADTFIDDEDIKPKKRSSAMDAMYQSFSHA